MARFPAKIHICSTALALLIALTVPVPGDAQSILAPAGPVGAFQRTILFDSLTIMLAIVIPTIAAVFAFAWWFRASNSRAVYMPDWDYSGRLEIIVWSIPTLVILFLGGVIWTSSHDLDPSVPVSPNLPPLQVQVVALDWKWLFIYPQAQIASVNSLVLPAGTPVRFSITSASVFNSFFIPRLGSQIYAMHSMVTQLNLQADQPGEYLGLSAQFSGDGFPDMQFKVTALPLAEFNQWIASARAMGQVLDETAYRALLRQSRNVTPYTYRAVQAGLFDSITMQMLPPGEGPATTSVNAAIRPVRVR